MLPLPSGYQFPNDNVPESEKLDPTFGLNCARALYWRYFNFSAGYGLSAGSVTLGGGYGWGWGDISALRIIELYGQSKQPVQKYKNWFGNFSQIGDGRSSSTRTDSYNGGKISQGERKAFANIDYSPVNPLDKLSNIVLSILAENDYKVDCTSTDQTTMGEKLYAKLDALYATKLTNPLAKKLGMPEIPTKVQPQDEDDADHMERVGMFKRDIEIALENLAENAFRISGWKNQRRSYNRNAIDFHYRCAKVYNDRQTGAVKIKFIDIKDLVMLFTRETDYEPVAIGHVEKMKVQDIYPQLREAGFSDNKISALAQKYAYDQVVDIPDWAYQKPDPVTGQWLWMDFLIPVMQFEYLSTDYKEYVRGKDEKGRQFYKKNKGITPKEQRAKEKNREYDDFKCNTWYRGNYICGSDMIYGWEKMPNQMHKNKLNPVSSYVFDHIPGTAPTQRVIGLCDDLMYGMLKLRAAVWAAPPPGFRIDIGGGSNIVIGRQEYTIFDLIHLYRQNGVMITASKFHASSGKIMTTPLEPIEGGLSAAALGWITYCNNALNNILDIFGIPSIMAAQPDQSAEKAVGVAETEYIAGNHALWPIKESEVLFKQRVAEKVILMTRMDIKYDPRCREYYQNQFGEDRIKLLDQLDNMTLEQLGITMKAMPTQKHKDIMMMRLSELAKMGTRDGIMIVTPSELETFEDLLNNDQIEEAKWYLARCEEKAIARSERNRTLATQETAKAQQESAIVAEQAKQQTNALATQGKLQEIAAQGNEDRNTLAVDYDFRTKLELAKQAQKGQIDGENIVLEATVEEATGTSVNNNNK